ncbi:hypothetical protein PF023_05495 [Enterococcus thailandicus]|uniref:hypothetical protein n=1 Tax=Enterococcus thailandicus TaxID=417368 RepID=UPI0022EBDDBF|nr:hypothetical protein [Enterococcus thailandicus]MDA3973490.1 hypothetical protein [Enterococcus thailandicus]MDA3975925.1 hypothetical protein [Enterococcus thailandicus]MDA3980949.1 hypothetical protein [Enterococcus thailandicus]
MSIVFWFFLVNPLIGVLLVPKFIFEEKKRIKAWSFLLGTSFGYMSYFINPSPTIDLARYFEKIEMLANFSMSQFLSYYDLSAKLDLSNWFFFLISKLNDVHFMPLIVITFVYTIIFYMILDNSTRNELSNKIVFLQIAIVVSFLSFPGVTSNIRNISAFVLFMFGFYLEVYHQKKNTQVWVIYILSVLLHKTAVILIAFRILSYVISKLKSKKILLSITLIFLFCSLTVSVIYHVVHMIPFTVPLTSIVDKAYTYATGFGSDNSYMAYIQGSLFMKLQKIFYLLINLLFLFLFYRNDYVNKIFSFVKDDKKQQFMLFYFLNLVLTIGTIPIILPVYWRFSFVSIIFSWCIVTAKAMRGQLLIIVTIFLILGGIIYQLLVLGQYTDFIEFIVNLFTNNYFSIFLR